MGTLGGLYRPTPRCTMVIRLDAGPAVSLSGRHFIRRLLGPADWPGTEPTGRVRRGRVLPAADYCSRALDDACLVMGSWQQPRRLAGDHCGHSPSLLDQWRVGPGGGLGRLPRADSRRVRLAVLQPSPEVSLTGGPCCLQAVQTSRRGRRTWYCDTDVRAGRATVPRRTEIFLGTACCGHACPW